MAPTAVLIVMVDTVEVTFSVSTSVLVVVNVSVSAEAVKNLTAVRMTVEVVVEVGSIFVVMGVRVDV